MIAPKKCHKKEILENKKPVKCASVATNKM